MPADVASSTNAETQFAVAGAEKYARRRFGRGPGLPLLSLQHVTGTMDNWDLAVTDPLATQRDVLLFDNAGSADQLAPCRARLLAWWRMPWRSLMLSLSRPAMSSASRLVA